MFPTPVYASRNHACQCEMKYVTTSLSSTVQNTYFTCHRGESFLFENARDLEYPMVLVHSRHQLSRAQRVLYERDISASLQPALQHLLPDFGIHYFGAP
jgi:hypothetical protein